MNAPDPLHWILNSCFGAFHSVWVHFESFFYCRKLGAKWAELVQLLQKIVPNSCIGIFATNAPDDPIGPQTHVLLCFVGFGCIWDHFVTA